MVVYCFACSKRVELDHKVSFREECPYCSADLHICRCCRFFDPSSYRECRESSAEHVKDKERNNYCEYFVPSDSSPDSTTSQREDHLKAAEKLFKKK